MLTIQAIADRVAGLLVGDPTIVISGIEQIESAQPTQLTFIGSQRYVPLWTRSRASAALVNQDLAVEPGPGRALIRVPNADLAMAEVLGLFATPAPVASTGIHPRAAVDPTASVGEGVSIGPGCYVGPGAQIGAGTCLYANVTVLDHSVVGAQCTLWPGVVVRERCHIGNGCILHPNVAIGADGFGFRPAPDGRGLVKIPQIGTVILGDGVEIGANSCVDRGKFSATSIGAGTKIDNLVQIGHNCRIGRSCVIAACTGIAGSVTLGDGVVVGGCVALKDHITVGSGVRIGGGSSVGADVPPGQTVVGYPAAEHRRTLRQWAALRRLPELLRAARSRGDHGAS
ncbi:MAG: UDP-3-O-(3-hydroxymyristoyl)glucosamine N-acyltransferase [Verrucomicrobiales bacterium]|nr:UDP-3-O-(3-hydroxymyristoyl)glucosamine N-acyltransferase [Verrucomicrobiales bacterium]MCP5528224.1 UDP-3-O-(3-hydroxymyristoyl)glucosamine N-acyltransferase [Verrucomicrobiales bacterium]